MNKNFRRAPLTFDDALEAIEAESDAELHKGSPAVAVLVPLAAVSPPSDSGFPPAFGQGPFGYESLADTPEREEVLDFVPTLGAVIKEVAAELGLSRASSAEELHHLRREFMWRNHPDRRPDVSPQWSNARVAVANMLIDRALEERSGARRRRV